MPSAPWYLDVSRKTSPVSYGDICLPKRLLDIAQLNVHTWDVGVPSLFCTGLIDKETTVSALLAKDCHTNRSTQRLLLRVKCSIKRHEQKAQSSASIQYRVLKSRRSLG